MLEVVELLDGPLGADAEGIFADAAAAARAVLASTTIADVVERENRDAGAPMYYIEHAERTIAALDARAGARRRLAARSGADASGRRVGHAVAAAAREDPGPAWRRTVRIGACAAPAIRSTTVLVARPRDAAAALDWFPSAFPSDGSC